jgi:hypothetical protein
MEVSCQLHAPPTLPLGKEHLVPVGQEAGWASEPIWAILAPSRCVCEKLSHSVRSEDQQEYDASSELIMHETCYYNICLAAKQSLAILWKQVQSWWFTIMPHTQHGWLNVIRNIKHNPAYFIKLMYHFYAKKLHFQGMLKFTAIILKACLMSIVISKVSYGMMCSKWRHFHVWLVDFLVWDHKICYSMSHHGFFLNECLYCYTVKTYSVRFTAS